LERSGYSEQQTSIARGQFGHSRHYESAACTLGDAPLPGLTYGQAETESALARPCLMAGGRRFSHRIGPLESASGSDRRFVKARLASRRQTGSVLMARAEHRIPEESRRADSRIFVQKSWSSLSRIRWFGESEKQSRIHRRRRMLPTTGQRRLSNRFASTRTAGSVPLKANATAFRQWRSWLRGVDLNHYGMLIIYKLLKIRNSQSSQIAQFAMLQDRYRRRDRVGVAQSNTEGSFAMLECEARHC
jgi:hypothetical protein